MSRLMVLLLALGVIVMPAGVASAGQSDQQDNVVLRRDEDGTDIVALDDDDDGNSNSNDGFSSGVDSNDGTGSGHSAVSRDRDRSRGDLTRDRTRDGAGGVKRDWSGGHTNDRSRNDTR